MKKILVFSPYYPPHIGGLETHCDEFNKYLSKKKFNITVFTPRIPASSLEKEIIYSNVTVIRFPAWEIIPNYPIPKFWDNNFFILWKGLGISKYSLVISRTRFFFTSLMAGFFCKKNNVKWIHIEHGSDFVHSSNFIYTFLAKLYDYTLGRCVLKFSDIVVANSIASASFCRSLYKRDYEIIYRGIEKISIANLAVDPVFLKYSDKVKIIYVGRLIAGKGIIDLIDAVSLIKKKDWILFIVGGGPQKEEIKKYIDKKSLSQNIVMLGEKVRNEAMKLLSLSNVVVNPSYSEGLPTSIIEASMFGKAIVATDVGGTNEIVKDKVSGLLVKPKNIIELKNGIEMFLDSKSLRKSMGKKAIFQSKKFNWENSILMYLKIISKLS